jgi:hypothetical protein
MALATDYLKLVLRLGRLVPGWVQYYVGPPELADIVAAEEAPSSEELQETVHELAERVRREVSELDRRRWLLAQLGAISTALSWLGGESFDYATLFERCHGARVELVPDEQFEQAHELLDRALHGKGDIGARYRAWRETQLVPRERLQLGIEVLSAEMRRRCREAFDLPEAEQVTWELVGGERWAGNSAYLGKLRSLIRINADLPISSPRLLELVCHEAYPGHHSESVCKDARLTTLVGRDELSVYVYPTPQAVMSEGLASYALEALLGSDAEQIAAERLRPAGISYDPETASVIRQAETLLLPVRSNIAFMLHQGARSDVARDYARAWLLDDTEQIDQAITHLEARSWRPYESCYPVGLALCRAYAGTDRSRFQDLLEQQLTPHDLVEHCGISPPGDC